MGSNPTLASKLSGVYKSYFNTFLIKWFNTIFPKLIRRFESDRKLCYINTFIAVPIINGEVTKMVNVAD